jgi:hypothetical protein
MRKRPPLPTLTEDDVRIQGERTTLPPPVPIDELVGKMMGDVSGEMAAVTGRRTLRRNHTGEVELGELHGHDEADILAEIGEAYLERLGDRAHVPFSLLSLDDMWGASLDHLSGFVLSMVDGTASVGDILDSAGMPEHETLRLLCELREQGLIDVRAAGSAAVPAIPKPPSLPGT